ncbi:MAG: NAD(P)H-dependent oxidoreductase [Bacteroidota bacterium]
MSTVIDALRWRYATKKFDAHRVVPDASISTIKEAVNLAATSYGLQPYRVVLVTDPEVKAKLREAAYGQPQLTDASHIFVFATKTDMTEAYVDDYMQRMADTRGIDVANLEGFSNAIKGSVQAKGPDKIFDWNARQTYIGLGHLLMTAAIHDIDACPMEGFNPTQVDEILGLQEKGLSASVIAAVGYRSEEDQLAAAPKVRLPLDEFFHEI